MNKIISVVLLFSIVLVFSGCATLFKGDSSKLGLTSNPQGAVVYANGAEICSSTPCSVKLKSGNSLNLLFKKDGFKDKTILVNNKVGAIWVILDILGGLIPVIIDAATGAWYEFDMDMATVTLEKM
jgi:hypothetical protein